jgi:hypothetical protein
VHEGGATKDSKIREVWLTSSEGGKGDNVSSLGPRSVANVDHSEEGKSPKAIRKRSLEKGSFCTIEKCSPLSLNASHLPVSIRNRSFYGDVRGTANGGE